MMNEEIKRFIEDNIELIEQNEWEQLYKKDFPNRFTDALLESMINPLEYGLNYIPKCFLYNSKIEEFIIPNNVTYIGEGAFAYCYSLKILTIGNSVTSIGNSAFYNCDSLKKITIGNNVNSIGDYAFVRCFSLENVKIPNSVTSIGTGAFSGCSSLANVSIGNSVTSIGEAAFFDCKKLTSITYLGTKEEAMQLINGNKSNKRWREGSAIKQIICTDGIIKF